MAPITISRVLCGLLLFLGTFALLADTTKTGSGQLSKAETRRLAASATATVSVATPASLVVRSTRTTTVSTTAIATTTALARAEPTPSNVVIVIDVPTVAPGESTPVVVFVAPAPTTVTAKPAPSLLHAAPLPDDPFPLFHNDDNKLLKCYPMGWWDKRWKFIESIENFCHAMDRESLSWSYGSGPDGHPNDVPRRIPLTGFRQHSYNWEDQLRLIVNSHYEISLDVKPGCEWEFDAHECGRYLRIPVDMCEMGTENEKKGGVVQARTGYGDLDVHKNEWTGAWESVWKGDEELKKHGEARLGDLEKKGMSRTCLVWRIDLETNHIDGADLLEGFPDGVGIDPGPSHDNDWAKEGKGGKGGRK
ncbi:uncharacterized protein B0T23DRAFT_436111 [Neurospora hispaniola]|uniref:Uncharacterized protein n=1 Tax=Neurospora hispaniola TaxID=588809 RepID=A0AAJ0HYG2_9PEZI|nr:hypothetical protein B0T23DRAFT_436111 [Neurospora hispaniola]